jgi:hypothetical protein
MEIEMVEMEILTDMAEVFGPGRRTMRNERLAKVTREHVLEAARSMRAKEVHRWGVYVDIDGVKTEVPAKQLLMAAANCVNVDAPRVTPADLIPHTAVRKLRKLRFEVVYHEEM